MTLSPSLARSAGRGLDWLNLFIANIQTGFGPFIAVYLTTQGWTQTALGFALSLGTIAAMASQVPVGALVDAAPRKSLVAAASVLIFTASSLIFALSPSPLLIYVAEVLHGVSSSALSPAIAAMSLAIAGQAALGLRLGRNARYASIGNGVGAALMGAFGYYISNQSVFFLTAALTIPALVALVPLARLDRLTGGGPFVETDQVDATPRPSIGHVLADRRILVLAACAMLFTLANAAMLPLASTAITRYAGDRASLLIAACIVLPQFIVALLSPHLGEWAEKTGRRPALLLAFSMLPLRGVLFALVSAPLPMVLIQALDGITAAAFGVLVPLITADITARTGHFNLSLGFIGFAIGLGATFSTTLAGSIADYLGDPAAFAVLALVGAGATLLVWGALPETRFCHGRPD